MSDALSPTITQPGITPYTWTQCGKAAALSLSATANVAVTEWQNADGYQFFAVRAVKTLTIEFLYAGIFAAGSLECVARAICFIPLFLIAIPAHCLKDYLPNCVVSVIGLLTTHAFYGTLASGATVVDALFALKGNLFGNTVKLSKTYAYTTIENSKKKDINHPLHQMTAPALVIPTTTTKI
jgi:hypothetical protein